MPAPDTVLEFLQRDELAADTLVQLVPVLDETLRRPVIHRGHVTEATRGLPVEQHADTRRARPFEPLMDDTRMLVQLRLRDGRPRYHRGHGGGPQARRTLLLRGCLLYTSDAADE